MWYYHILPCCNNVEIFLIVPGINHHIRRFIMKYFESRKFNVECRFRLSSLQSKLLDHMIPSQLLNENQVKSQTSNNHHTQVSTSSVLAADATTTAVLTETNSSIHFRIYSILYYLVIRDAARINSIL